MPSCCFRVRSHLLHLLHGALPHPQTSGQGSIHTRKPSIRRLIQPLCVVPPGCCLPASMQVTTCCFDKTGTLTSDHMVLEGVAGAEGQEGALVADVKTLPTATSRVLACCQSLLQVGLMGAEG